MKRSHESARPVSWIATSTTRLCLYIPTNPRGTEILNFPRSTYFLPNGNIVIDGLDFHCYALLQTDVSMNEVSTHLQRSYLHVHGTDDRGVLRGWEVSQPHRYRLAKALDQGALKEKAQRFIRVETCPDSEFDFKYANFETVEFTGIDPKTGVRVHSNAKSLRKVRISTASHHVFAHIIGTKSPWDTLCFSRNSSKEHSHAFLLLYREAKTQRMRMARDTHALAIIKDQLPLVVDDFVELIAREKAASKLSNLRNAGGSTEKFYEDVRLPGASPPLPMVPITASSSLSVQCDARDVVECFGFLLSGAFELFGNREFSRPLDMPHFLGVKTRFLEQVVPAGKTLFRISYDKITLVRSIGGFFGAACPRAKTTDELVARHVHIPKEKKTEKEEGPPRKRKKAIKKQHVPSSTPDGAHVTEPQETMVADLSLFPSLFTG